MFCWKWLMSHFQKNIFFLNSEFKDNFFEVIWPKKQRSFGKLAQNQFNKSRAPSKHQNFDSKHKIPVGKIEQTLVFDKFQKYITTAHHSTKIVLKKFQDVAIVFYEIICILHSCILRICIEHGPKDLVPMATAGISTPL